MPTKDHDARVLAELHYRVEPGITEIYRIAGIAAVESQSNEPIKLLEVNKYSIPSGVMPLQFDAAPARGIHYPSIIVEVTPDEFAQIQTHELALPAGWTVSDPIPRPADNTAA